MRWGFFLKEALRGLRRSSAPALAALLTVLLTALVLGVFIPIVQATTGTANEAQPRGGGRVREGLGHPGPASRAREALEATGNVKSVEYISKGEALAQAQEKNPKAFRAGAELLGANPLPASFRVTPRTRTASTTSSAGWSGTGPQLAAIDEVRDREEDTDEILSATDSSRP